MRKFRLRRQADGSLLLNQVHPNPSGLSVGKEVEDNIVTLTPEEADAMDRVDESDPPTAPVAPSAPTTEVAPPASEIVPPASGGAPPVDVPQTPDTPAPVVPTVPE